MLQETTLDAAPPRANFGLKDENSSRAEGACASGHAAIGRFNPIHTCLLTGIERRQFASACCSERLRLLATDDDSLILSARKPILTSNKPGVLK